MRRWLGRATNCPLTPLDDRLPVALWRPDRTLHDHCRRWQPSSPATPILRRPVEAGTQVRVAREVAGGRRGSGGDRPRRLTADAVVLATATATGPASRAPPPACRPASRRSCPAPFATRTRCRPVASWWSALGDRGSAADALAGGPAVVLSVGAIRGSPGAGAAATSSGARPVRRAGRPVHRVGDIARAGASRRSSWSAIPTGGRSTRHPGRARRAAGRAAERDRGTEQGFAPDLLPAPPMPNGAWAGCWRASTHRRRSRPRRGRPAGRRRPAADPTDLLTGAPRPPRLAA